MRTMFKTAVTGSASMRGPGPRRRARARAFRPGTEGLEARQLLAVEIGEAPVGHGFGWDQDITTGPDGNLWFTEFSHTIGRLTTDGTYTEFQVPGYGALGAITAGPDGNLWFTDNSYFPIIFAPGVQQQGGSPSAIPIDSITPAVGRITPDGLVTEFPVAPGQSLETLAGITAGPDGNLWFAAGLNIDRITPSGTITSFTLPTGSGYPNAIVSGPNGNLWFTTASNQIGSITTDGVISILPTPLTGSVTARNGLTLGPDGNLWAAVGSGAGNSLDRVTPGGTVTAFALPEQPLSVTSGPDGNLWLVLNTEQVARFALDGTTTVFNPPSRLNPYSGAITAGPDGNLWFLEGNPSRVGRVVLDAPDPGAIALNLSATLSLTEGTTFSGQLASFQGLAPGETADQFVAWLDWGDGVTTQGTIAPDGQGGFTVSGTHTYLTQGDRSVVVTVTDAQLAAPGAMGQAALPVHVADAPLTTQPVDTFVYTGQTSPIVVGTAAAVDSTGTYTATINWGDGTTSVGEVASTTLGFPNSPQNLTISGSHIYLAEGDYKVSTVITDDAGLSTTITSVIHYRMPHVYSKHSMNVEAKLGIPTGETFSGTLGGPGIPGLTRVGLFYLTGPAVPANLFSATIDWGDGSGPVPAVVTEVYPSVYSVSGTHTFNKVGTYRYTITFSGFNDIETITGDTHVNGPPLALAGGLSPASDTGYSAHDGITSATTPRFQGTATPGTTVQLYARPGDGSPLFTLGKVVADSGGHWTIVSPTLREGTYTLFANETARDGRKLLAVPIATGAPGGQLVVDTSGPQITSATFNPATSQITLTFQDSLSQVNPLGLVGSGAIRFSRVTAAGQNVIPTRVQSIARGGSGVVISLGHSVPNGRYALQIAAGGIRDAAGNALDGEFRGIFPTGDGRTGGNFLGQFPTRGKTPVPALAIALAPRTQPQASRSALALNGRHKA